MAKLQTYDARVQAPGQNIVPLGPVMAENDDQARYELGRLVRMKHAKAPIDEDSDVWLFRPDKSEVEPQSKVGEHLIRR